MRDLFSNWIFQDGVVIFYWTEKHGPWGECKYFIREKDDFECLYQVCWTAAGCKMALPWKGGRLCRIIDCLGGSEIMEGNFSKLYCIDASLRLL